jgi:hypothetical protein
MLPNAITALRGLREQLPQMGEYHQRAVELAARLPEVGLRVWPDPPHSNAFRIFVDADSDELNERLVSFIEAESIAVSPPWGSSEVPGWSWTEFTIGPASLQWTVDELLEVLGRALAPP